MRKFKFLVLTITAPFLLAAGVITVTGLADRIGVGDMIVVPGNTVSPDGTPSPRLQARLDAALRLFQHHRARMIFVSGATGKEGFDEARAMTEYLIRNGVPASALVQDSYGVNTAATAEHAARFMQARHLKTAIVSTQYFHVARMTLALERNGVRVIGHVHARYVEWRDLYSLVRETVAYAEYYARL